MTATTGVGGDDATRGVSSTIATVLMVAIVVLVATVTGAFLALDDDVERDPAPQVTFSFAFNETTRNLTVVHEGGEPVPNGTLSLAGDVATGPGSQPDPAVSETTNDDGRLPVTVEMTGGVEIVVVTSSAEPTVRFVHDDPDRPDDERTATVAVYSR